MISGALLIGAVANIVFNGVTGTGNTRSAFVMELATLVFYTLFIYVVGMRLHMPVAICFMTEVVYYTGLLVASVIYLKKASWQNKKIWLGICDLFFIRQFFLPLPLIRRIENRIK